MAMLPMPESPLQLARAGARDQAAAALAWLQDTTPEQARYSTVQYSTVQYRDRDRDRAYARPPVTS